MTGRTTGRALTKVAASRVDAVVAGGDAGMSTAEYAVGTVAACGFGAVLFKIVTSDAIAELLSGLLRHALTVLS